MVILRRNGLCAHRRSVVEFMLPSDLCALFLVNTIFLLCFSECLAVGRGVHTAACGCLANSLATDLDENVEMMYLGPITCSSPATTSFPVYFIVVIFESIPAMWRQNNTNFVHAAHTKQSTPCLLKSSQWVSQPYGTKPDEKSPILGMSKGYSGVLYPKAARCPLNQGSTIQN